MIIGSGRAARSSQQVTLFKYQALGNTYLVFDPQINLCSAESIEVSKDWIRSVCSADFGVGSNGLLVGPNSAADGKFEFKVVNSDGTLAQFSGNGSRIFARYLLDANYPGTALDQEFSVIVVSPRSKVVVDILPAMWNDDRITTDIHVAPAFGSLAVKARTGAVQGDGVFCSVAALADIGRRHNLAGRWTDSSLVSIGNPHCVSFFDKLDILPSIETLSRLKSELALVADRADENINVVFEEGCNLQWCFVQDRRTLHLRIVERGEGPTLASGSSASAAVIAAQSRGLIDDAVTVIMPGGSLDATLLLDAGRVRGVRLTGQAERLAEVRVSAPA
jgi:diaminopimelate epimerase